MHNGFLSDFVKMKRDLTFAVDPSLYPHIHGTTDSEVIFHLALTLGLRDDPIAGVTAAVQMIESVGRDHGINFPMQGTMALSDGATIWAFRYSTQGRSRSLFHSQDIDTLREMYPEVERLNLFGRTRPRGRLRATQRPARCVHRGARVDRRDPGRERIRARALPRRRGVDPAAARPGDGCPAIRWTGGRCWGEMVIEATGWCRGDRASRRPPYAVPGVMTWSFGTSGPAISRRPGPLVGVIGGHLRTPRRERSGGHARRGGSDARDRDRRGSRHPGPSACSRTCPATSRSASSRRRATSTPRGPTARWCCSPRSTTRTASRSAGTPSAST